MSEEKDEAPKRRPVFDPRISFGNVITLIGMAIAVFSAWSTMDKRVTLLESQQAHQIKNDERQDLAAADSKREIKEQLKEINSKLDRLIEGRRINTSSTGVIQ